ncbi:FAD-binding oxidoreductase [uncultured Maritalea sp.]|uniref:NAD(P)/FAD-dependent oxidoreductase n=1 Tax=uncultured Maritalea sp. TaxID=757249 RepID=UPI00260CB3B5|nr:FAD-binding oxidoreductase [uncultured Maritalea sp.]
MKRIYEPMAYGAQPIENCYWHGFMPDNGPQYPSVSDEINCDFAIIGAGYTGLSAALRLAKHSADVVVVDANAPGWGASGRNGGLVSVGGSKLSDKQIVARFGQEDARTYFATERAAVDFVEGLIVELSLDVDRHSKGYTFAAHSETAVSSVKDYGAQYQSRYGLDCEFLDKSAMAEHGMGSPEFHGAVNLPIGFALNPMKFILGLAHAASSAGVRIFANSAVQDIEIDDVFSLHTASGIVRAKKLIVATNGYSSDDVPNAFASRYMPVQSNIMVTRPLTDDELASQRWWSEQMVVDTRNLLHYFRLLPDKRMLFGLRGSVRASVQNMEKTKQIARADFDRLFPKWRKVETDHFWSGLICMSRDLVPFAGPIAGIDGAYAAMAYHGNGVSMAPYCGALVADMALGNQTMPHAQLMQKQMRKFELGPLRRNLLPPAFAWYKLLDRI